MTLQGQTKGWIESLIQLSVSTIFVSKRIQQAGTTGERIRVRTN